VADLYISDNCGQNENSYSILGVSYGTGPGVNRFALFGQEDFRMVDYEVFKIVIE
jgi:microcystin-dependent protein